ncbi:MAG: cellulase family glycosylhydrolase [Candidatus Pacebacteria bacterium]|nr:cellulase family glycosylhydrolase [Candidatus Paceibacterota bacterium]MDD3072338.1 cellulase family glycosylhydrolase [Candidatus Paceibacterota bacterium]MDD3728732.1 cellulase family glycosylhydrolase [Candidatus Paceibacterota bacterium]MDD4897198.1 cellulase family glycosylhydrolase [Candidatus Paceibacterota bacterium]MDD5445704.1 cellulase family glycosylhydrolase [Candidatus Paceibacterota bacterium]
MLLLVIIIFLVIFAFFFLGFPKEKEDLFFGVNFSPKHARDMGLDVKETYLAILNDLKANNIKIAVHWDDIEIEDKEYDFRELDFMVEEAEKKEANIVLVLGMKTSRWPECHIPYFAKEIEKEKQQKKILEQIEKIVLRYKDKENIKAFQVENEPFFPFGDCPWTDEDFLKEEINLVRGLSNRPIIISETGEFSLWLKAAKLGDIVGVTMYRRVWFNKLKRHIDYPFPAVFYSRKALLIKWIFNKEVIGVELQMEPWGSTLLYYSPLEEQEKSMNIEQFKKNIRFAKKVGFKENYLWGVEWWFWMKKEHNDSSFLNEAKKLWK